jgi:hypothetical protein
MDYSLSAVSKQVKRQGVIEFLMHENETPIRIHWQRLDLYGEDAVNMNTVHRWVTKSRDSGGNFDLIDHLWSGIPVYHNLRFEHAKSRRTSQATVAAKLNIGLASVNKIIAGLGYKKVCDLWVSH